MSKDKSPSKLAELLGKIPPLALYLALIICSVVVYYMTEPEASYINHDSFHKWVACIVALFLVRAVIELIRQYDMGQLFKVLFWAGWLVYTLGDIIPSFGRMMKRFTHVPEMLVVCYVLAIILKEKEEPEQAAESGTKNSTAKQGTN